MARLDDRLTRELREAGPLADPTGVYEQLIRRRERRRIAERVRKATVILVATTIAVAGTILVVQAFERPDRATVPVEPSVIEPHENGLIAFSREATGGLELHVVEPDGSNERTIPTPPGMPWLHAWSPDGDRIAVTIFPNAGGERSIWVMDADGSDPVRVAQADNVSVPSWSPDGTRIAYASEEGGRTEIHVVGADGSQDRVVHGEGAEGTFAIFSAQFSPDGTQLLFDRGTDSGFDIFVMRVDGSAVRRLTTTGTDYDPHWSPDGREIAFTRQGEGPRSDIYVMRADGSDVRQLTSGGDGDTNLYPQWSPDGRSIAYLAGRGGGPGGLVVMGADGSDPRVLVEADRSGGVLGISWQPLPAGTRSSGATGSVG
ncbi:MAG TPA: LpqB family beta-propeller domain-containing protein, partial [Actinomycetota bacterium]|nr:LpqB family beta-propeller domain-containing protein [Actinomycetota bacterium]